MSGATDLAIDTAWSARLLTGFIRREVTRTGARHVVLGLSGGVDSAVSAYLGVAALGPDSVHALLMPHRNSHPSAVADAQRVVDALGIDAEQIDISPMSDAFERLSGEVDRNRVNQARERESAVVLLGNGLPKVVAATQALDPEGDGHRDMELLVPDQLPVDVQLGSAG